MAFLPAEIAFDGSGNLVVFNLSPPEIFRISPSGKLSLLGTGYATQLTTAPDGKVLVASRYGSVQEATNTGLKTLINLNPPRIAGFGLPGERSGFQADGIAVAPSGALYLDTDDENGWSDATGLVRVGLDGKGEVLPIKTPLLATLPAVGPRASRLRSTHRPCLRGGATCRPAQAPVASCLSARSPWQRPSPSHASSTRPRVSTLTCLGPTGPGGQAFSVSGPGAGTSSAAIPSSRTALPATTSFPPRSPRRAASSWCVTRW